MARIPDHIKIIIDKYLRVLDQNGIILSDALLFGSYAKDEARQYSDIDLAIVSDIFEGIRFTDKKKIQKFTLRVSSDLSVLPFNPKDFTNDNPLVREILETGVRVL